MGYRRNGYARFPVALLDRQHKHARPIFDAVLPATTMLGIPRDRRTRQSTDARMSGWPPSDLIELGIQVIVLRIHLAFEDRPNVRRGKILNREHLATIPSGQIPLQPVAQDIECRPVLRLGLYLGGESWGAWSSFLTQRLPAWLPPSPSKTGLGISFSDRPPPLTEGSVCPQMA